MSNAISDLHRQFIDFAAGMPAISISWRQIERDIALTLSELEGVKPDRPSVFLGDVDMPVYGLAYSIFIDDMKLKSAAGGASLQVQMTVTVHPKMRTDLVIRQYIISSAQSAALSLDLDPASNELFWVQQGASTPQFNPSWGADPDTALSLTTVPAPQKDNFLREVEQQVIWLTGASFIRLVANRLPRYSLTEIVPWLRLQAPLRFHMGSEHIVVTARRASLIVGSCTPESVSIEPDPAFPYDEVIPTATLSSREVDFSVYSPRSRIVHFFADQIKPAVLVSDSGGGTIGWSMSGSIGLRNLDVFLATMQGPRGVLSINAGVEFVGAARAWIDGPCGMQIALASASVIGEGTFGADIVLEAKIQEGTIEANLVVTQSDLPNVHWDINTPIGWPLTAIAAELANRFSRSEVRKLAGSVSRVGKWSILGLTQRYLDTMGKYDSPIAYSEGLSQVSAVMAIFRKNSGRGPKKLSKS